MLGRREGEDEKELKGMKKKISQIKWFSLVSICI
jgi:hypothetical protein